MRTARFIAIVLLVAAILAATFYILRFPLAGWAVRTAMAAAGVEQPHARVTALSLGNIRIEDVRAGPQSAPSLELDVVEADFGWFRLLTERAVNDVRVGPGAVRIIIAEDGSVTLPIKNQPSASGSSGGALPFDQLTLREIALTIDAPQGDAAGIVTAEFNAKSGGHAALSASTDLLAWEGVTISGAEAAGDLAMSADGSTQLVASFNGEIDAAGAAARDVSVSVIGEGASWRDALSGSLQQFAGTARLEFASPDIEVRDEQILTLLSATQMETIFGEKLQRAAISGALAAEYGANGATVRIADDSALAITTPDGSSLVINRQGAAPIYARNSGRATTSFQFALASDGVNAKGAVDTEREGDKWRLAAPIEIDEFNSPSLALDGSRVDVAAVSTGNDVIADITLKSGLRKAVVGRLTIDDAPFSGAFRINADMAAKRAVVSSVSDCFAIDRGRARIGEQDLDFRLAGITLCNAEGPLAVYTWTGETACTLSGELSARDGSLKLANTYAKGRPPVVRFDASYHPAQNTTSINADISNGAMVLNDALDVAAVIGRVDFTLDADVMRASANLDRLQLTQHISDPEQMLLFSPVTAAGEGELDGDDAVFTYTLTTPEGYRLGVGTGAHNMKTASGETVITIENLTFVPIGLQPNKISPALKGIVDAADGAVHGQLMFGWGPDALTSSANLELDNISFNGPTRAVTRTRNLNGSIQLTDLLPIATNGIQTITVAGVNLDALKLETGVMEFSMPGDDTFVLQRGEFPWFGGTIGVYDAKASFAGQAEIPMRAQSIDLKQVLEYINVEGLSGEGQLSGSLPLVFEEGRASIVNGVLKADGPGVVRYKGAASEQAAAAGENADVAFDLLQDLRYSELEVTVDGALDGALKFGMRFEGVGDVSIRNGVLNDVPVIYRINLAIENVDLLRKANLANAIKRQLERELNGEFQ